MSGADAAAGLPWTRWVVRRMRGLPGYRIVRRRVLARLRTSSMAREIVRRVWGPPRVSTKRGPLPGAKFPQAGVLVTGRNVERLPVAVICLLGLREETVGGVIDQIARCQLLSAGFRPVLVFDGPHLGTARRFGYVAELLVPEEAWSFPDQEWDDYAAQRLASIRCTYAASLTVSVGEEGLTQGARVILRSLAPLT